MNSIKHAIILILAPLVLAGCASKLVYHPYKKLAATPEAAKLAYQDVHLKSTGGNLVHGWWVPCENPRGAVFLDSAFTSTYDVARLRFKSAPKSLLKKHVFNNMERIGKVASPVCIIHSRQDQVIPFSMGVSLYNAAGPDKAFVEIKGGHNDGFMKSMDVYSGAIDLFLKKYGFHPPAQPIK